MINNPNCNIKELVIILHEKQIDIRTDKKFKARNKSQQFWS